MTEDTKSSAKKAFHSSWAEYLSSLNSFVVILGIAFLLRASVVEAFKIPTSSMEQTLEIGDHILVNKLSYGLRLPFVENSIVKFRTPKRGDVVVFTLPDDPLTPEDEADINIIKRIIGLPGDEILVEGTKVYINGRYYKEDERFARWVLSGKKNFGPITVPSGKVFLMGDNRDQSRDSRFWDDPFLDIRRIKGRAFIIYWNWPNPFRRMFRFIE